MRRSLLVKAQALEDLNEAYDFYESSRPGLGSEFLDEAEQCFENIRANPEQYRSIGHERISIMRRFPYKVIFGLEDSTIFIYAVYHDKRNPETISRR